MSAEALFRPFWRKRVWAYAAVFVVSVVGLVGADLEFRSATGDLARHDLALHTITGDFNRIRTNAFTLAEKLDEFPEGQIPISDLRDSYGASMVRIDEASADVATLVDQESINVLHQLLHELGGVDRLISSTESGAAIAPDQFKSTADDLLESTAGMADGTELVIVREGFADHFPRGLRESLVVLPIVAVVALLAFGREMIRGVRLAHDETKSRLAAEDHRRDRAERLAQGQSHAMELIAAGASIDVVEASLSRLVTTETEGDWRLDPSGLSLVEGNGGEISADLAATVLRVRELVTERDRVMSRLSHEASHDGLTGLHNREALVDHMETLGGDGDADRALSVVFLDFRHFRMVNDTYGHEIGDEVLRLAASRLRAVARSGDFVARISGNEFVVVLCRADESVAHRLAHRIHDSLSRPYSVGGVQVELDPRLGVSTSEPGEVDTGRLLREADDSMHHAKKIGEPIVFIDDSLRAVGERSREVELRIGDAFHDDGIVVVYQPLVEMSSGRMVGVEALARLRVGDDLLTPDSFIEVAEATGQIVELDRTVLRIAAAQVAEWKARFGREIELAVNISGVHANRRDALSDLESLLRHAGLDSRSLVVEINEGVFLHDARAVAGRLSALRDMGVRISIDDFGTGYSSLSDLQELPVDILKIDRAFVDKLGRSRSSDAVVKTIVELAAALGYDVVAEGIETPQQLDLLRQLGCQIGQGYHFDRPVNAADLEHRWLSQDRGNSFRKFSE